ncbi:MAG: metallophosphoesterase [Acutalibacteraceae bacterium]|nr:metallophosphoesterase [Acutalibacteraceae bacterium]
MRKIKKKTMIIASIILIVLITALSIYVHFENKKIDVSEIYVNDSNIPKEFNNFKIMQISDLHNSVFGENNQDLIDVVIKNSPDIIVITGDIIDSYHPDVDISVDFIKQIQNYAPIYYVNGNHEYRLTEEYAEFKSKIINFNVTVLENSQTVINKNGAKIDILGVNDPTFSYLYGYTDDETNLNNYLDSLDYSSDNYKILLSHRPEKFELYCNHNLNLVFCGHAHGGQIRIPYIGGLYAPHQGLFPKYTSGIYNKGNTNMIVSRGLRNRSFPARINNNPEVVIAILKSK